MSDQPETVVVQDQYGRPHEFKANDWTRNSDGSITVLRSGGDDEDEVLVATFAPGWQVAYHGGTRAD